MRQYDLPVSSDTWFATIPGRGRTRLQNLWAVSQGQSRQAIVVMAHRDDAGDGPGADDNATGTAALVELARGYALSTTPGTRVRSGHTIVFLSTDAGSFGGLGALRFASHPPFRVVAAIDLDAIGGRGEPRIEIAGDAPRSPAASLVQTAARRIDEQAGRSPGRPSVVAQLIDLGFPFTLYGQGPFVARDPGADADDFRRTAAGGVHRPHQHALDDAPRADRARRPAAVGSLDQGLELAQGTTTFVWIGQRFVRGWSIEVLLFTLLIPYLVAVVDLFAHCRRRRIPLLPAVRSLRSRLAIWLFVGAAFYVLRFFGAWPSGEPRPPSPASRAAGDWSVLALVLLAVISFAGWLLARQRLAPHRRVSAEEQLAGETAALIGLGIVALLALATNPYALVFFVPALHAWLWLPQVRSGRRPLAVLLLVVGLAGPLLIVLSLAIRFGLGFDAPWYLLELVSLGYVHVPAVAITLAGAACAAQLAAVTANRYAPYPARDERPRFGPFRTLVRALVLSARARRA